LGRQWREGRKETMNFFNKQQQSLAPYSVARSSSVRPAFDNKRLRENVIANLSSYMILVLASNIDTSLKQQCDDLWITLSTSIVERGPSTLETNQG
jgi:hypothetical protein